MSYFNGMNGPDDWAKGTDESLGDLLEEKIEDKTKDKAEDGAKWAGKKALHGVDKLTDKISPIKAIKNKIKDLWHNNPIARLKRSVQNLKKKAKKAIKKGAKEGIKAAGKLAAKVAKKAIGFIAAHPVAALVILIIIIILYCLLSPDPEEESDSSGGGDLSQFEEQMTSNVDDLTGGVNGMLQSSTGGTGEDVVVLLIEDCVPDSEAVSQEAVGTLESNKEESAKRIYGVFHTYGFNNASIAGMLANLDVESGLDPSCIEGIYDEYGFIGTRKAAALLSMSDYTVNTLFPLYAESGISLNKNGYKAVNSSGVESYYCGMGLVQWTGPGAMNFLSAAETLGTNWYTMDFQLAYMLSDTLYRKGFFAGWVASQGGDDMAAAKDAAVRFAHEYEGNSAFDAKRIAAAETWYNTISGWGDTQADQAYVDSIVAMATQLGGLIEFTDVANVSQRCGNTQVFDNSSLASAAVSYSWPTKEQSYNNGTNLYQAVITGIWPGDTHFMACDRAVAGAVRWSGTDDEYPLVTSTQADYLAASPKWELVGTADSLSMDVLQPGDVFIVKGHTFMYVGEPAITAAYAGEAEAGSNTVSASLDERSASCNADTTSYMNKGGADSNGTYSVYRCKQPDKSTTYKNIGSGVTN